MDHGSQVKGIKIAKIERFEDIEGFQKGSRTDTG